jgi:energy-coupling factor transport system permease protein
MIRDITIGQYYPAQSVLHRLDPRTKIIGTFFFVVGLFLEKNIGIIALSTVFLLAMVKLSQIPIRFILRGLKPIFILLLISVIFNVFFTPGEILLQIGIIKISKEGLELAAFIAIRLVYLIVGTSFFTLTTTPTRLTDGLESLFGWMNRFHVPVHEIAMMMSIALRFIPILVEELDKIMKAQSARGADFESGSFMKRVKSLIPVLVPLFVSAIGRANDLAMAMEARCYRGGAGRTKMHPLQYTTLDRKAFTFLGIYFIITICMKVVM